MNGKKELAVIGLILMSTSAYLIIVAPHFLPMLVIGILNGIAGILLIFAALRKA